MKKKVLHYIPGFEIGGIESLFLDLIEKIDREKYEIYLLTEREINKDIKNLLRYNEVTLIENKFSIKKHPVKYLKEMYNILKINKWDIVHLHISYGRDFMIYFSKILKIPKIIMHAHTTKIGIDSKIGRFIFLKFFPKKNIKYIGCSKEAGEYFFGKKLNVNIITNGVNFEKFKFNDNIKETYTKKLDLENKKIIGMIGRISYPKNHKFAIEIFEKLNGIDKSYVLLLIGSEADEKKIPQLVKEKGLEDKVIFLGARNDIRELLSLIDVYLMPSIYEGLSVGLLEAQASGVQCLISDAITPKNIVTNNVKVLSLNASSEIWAKNIIELYNRGRKIIDYDSLDKSEYSIKTFVKKIEEVYEK